MSKITDLRLKATEASRNRKWEEAIRLYERICDLEGSNAGYRNELGDVYAKMGDICQAIVQFEKAVELYNAVGLNNNAVAVLKKILRYDPVHMECLWTLGETRRKQGLGAEASTHYLQFLDCAGEITDETRERFLDRCAILLEVLPGDLDILGRLDQLYEDWNMPAERARILLCKALLAREAGEEDIVHRYIERARTLTDRIESIPEYQKLVEDGVETVSGEESGGDAAVAQDEDATEDSKVVVIEDEPTFDSGEFSLDLDFDVPVESGTVDPLEEKAPEVGEPSEVVEQGINLLEEILAEGDVDLAQSEANQVESIRQDLEGQIATDVRDDDYQGHYELGLVYMDMGMIEQALLSFSKAAEGEETRLKALEMKGNCLRKLDRMDEALAAYQEGLATTGRRPLDYMGLIYEVGACLEAMGRTAESVEYYERVAGIDPSFLDVRQRLENLRQQS